MTVVEQLSNVRPIEVESSCNHRINVAIVQGIRRARGQAHCPEIFFSAPKQWPVF